MAEIDPVILQLRADLDKYLADVRRATNVVEVNLGQQERAFERLEQKIAAANRRAAESARDRASADTSASRDSARASDQAAAAAARRASEERAARERADRAAAASADAERRRLRELDRARERAASEERRRQAAAAAATERLRAQQANIRRALLGTAATVGVYFGARELVEITDKYTQFVNGLRVAGVESKNFGQVQDSLFASAQKYGVELNTLGALYGKAAQAASELGIGQQDLLKFTNGIAAALKVQGGSIESARGALLQLGQALQSGTVRAEEYNSINEGAFPILQAVAKGTERFGGSVAELRKQVIAGTVTSREFFNGFVAGSEDLEAKAARATLTTAAGFTTLKNALEVYIGQANEVVGISAALGAGLKTLAENVDTLIPAIAIVGTALGIGFVTNAATAAIAARGLGAAILGIFGGPVGLAITAVTVGIASFGVEAAKTSALIEGVNRVSDELIEKFNSANIGAGAAASGVAGLGTDALGAIPQVNAFAGAVGNLAQQLYGQARAARVANLALLNKQLTEGRDKESQLGDRTRSARVTSGSQFREAIGRGDFLAAAGIYKNAAVSGLSSALSGGRTDREAQNAYRQQIAQNRILAQEVKAAANPATIGPADLPGGAGRPVSAPGTTRAGGRSTRASGAGAAQASNVRAVRDEEAYNNDKSRLDRSILEARQDYAFDAATDVQLQKERIDEEGRNQVQRIKADLDAGKYSAEQAKVLAATNDVLIAERKKAVDKQVEYQAAQDRVSLASAQIDNEIEMERRLAL